MDCSPPGSFVHGIFHTRILEWVCLLFSRDLSNPGIKPESPTLQADSLPSGGTREALSRTEVPLKMGLNPAKLSGELECIHDSQSP